MRTPARRPAADLDRLLDARHAGMTETLVRRLSSLPDWIVQPEVTFSINLPVSVGVWVVVADGRTAWRRLAEHRSTLKRAFTADGHAMERWIHSPGCDVSGLSFPPFAHPVKVGRRRSVAA
jgi:hypothetical protein